VAELNSNGELPKRVPVRTSKHLNNLIEQDHRRVKQRLRPMRRLGGLTATMPEIWQAALAA